MEANDTLLSRGEVADDEATDDEHENSREEIKRQKKKTEGIAEPQDPEKTAGSKLIAAEKTSGKKAKTSREQASAPKKRAAGKSRATPKRAAKSEVSPAQAASPKTGTQATVVRKLLKTVEEKLSREDMKASLGDYIRLVQLQKELDDEVPREIKVTWVDQPEQAAEGSETRSAKRQEGTSDHEK